jgi:carbamoyl-phosphate synthase small subunit
MSRQPTAILLLEDGRFFYGYTFGAAGETTGELCFNTGLTGYQEILTDPSYCGQIVIMTTPHVGNYGINADDVESARIQVAGFVVKEATEVPSNWRSTGSLGDYLQEQGIVGIQGVDTRALVRHIRERGAMNGIISTVDFDRDYLQSKLSKTPSMEGLDLVREVTCRETYPWKSETAPISNFKFQNRNNQYRVAALDFGIKWNILRLLRAHGCAVTVFPATTPAETILEADPDGVFLSNGPGDPAAVSYAITTVKKLLGKKPIFGICLGHQILALALGARTFKLKFGHRGLNHPVQHLATGRVEITSQNHGFAVDADSLPDTVEVTHLNLNDHTLEGLRCLEIPAFSVQYHPEASPGPHDSRYLFSEFITLMETLG